MKRLLTIVCMVFCCLEWVAAQDLVADGFDGDDFGGMNTTTKAQRDSAKMGKVVPEKLVTWTIDERFGDRTVVEPDTAQHMYMNSIFTTGLRGEYITTGNLGAPRMARMFTDRPEPGQFPFSDVYDFVLTPIGKLRFTNTLSPITNISYDECGNKQNGEDHLKALFAVNAGKKLGVGMKFDYLYGRGYYENQSTSHFNYTVWGSYLSDRYDAHLVATTLHQKVTENGGVIDDSYITTPSKFGQTFTSEEIPTVMEKNWNRGDSQHLYFNHAWKTGYYKKVPMTEDEISARRFALAAKEEKRRQMEEELTARGEPIPSPQNEAPVDTSWTKREYIPLSSIIHTLKVDNHRRIYEAYSSPQDYYLNRYDVEERFSGDSIYDEQRHLAIRNTLALSLLEDSTRMAVPGVKAFVASDYRRFRMPALGSGTDSYSEHSISIGGQILKTLGSTIHYGATAEAWLAGEDAGQLKIDGHADLSFPLWGETIQLAARGWFHRLNPTFFQRHYHSRHYWWDNDNLSKELRTHIEGTFSLKRTRTQLRVAVDNIENYTYLAHSYGMTESGMRTGNHVEVRQSGENISVITAQLSQDLTWAPVSREKFSLNWESVLTYQKSTSKTVLDLPTFTAYTNAYMHVRINRVLKVDLGADLRYFSDYYAPDYAPGLGQYTVQDNGEGNVKVGNYPFINVYANCHLKKARFFIMMSHVNWSSDGGRYFLAPHYPANQNTLRIGVSWNFKN